MTDLVREKKDNVVAMLHLLNFPISIKQGQAIKPMHRCSLARAVENTLPWMFPDYGTSQRCTDPAGTALKSGENHNAKISFAKTGST